MRESERRNDIEGGDKERGERGRGVGARESERGERETERDGDGG